MPFSEDLRIKFKNIVNQRCGLYFRDYDFKDLEKAINLRMEILTIESALVYYNLLLFSDKKEDEFRELLNLLTVNHTYFFRNEPQFKALKEKILPEIIESKLNQKSERPSLRIWSAGCSTGEEPYTIAMIIDELIPDRQNWDIQILATDASVRVLDEAAQGVYGTAAMRLTPREYRDKYFDVLQIEKLEKYKIHDGIKQLVKFGFFNLMDTSYPQGYDVIFCRNVVIYFDTQTVVNVMHKIYESLNPQGYLLIGYSESLQFISERFKMQDWQEAIYYRKAARQLPAEILAAKEFTIDRHLERLARAEVAAELKEISQKHEVAPTKKIEEFLVQIVSSLHSKHYDYAWELVEQAHKLDRTATDLYYLGAEALANQGKIKEAKQELKEALKINAMFAPAHYLFAAFSLEEGQPEVAKQSLKKSLYLDANFILAHFDLANVYKNEGKINEALREYRNTLNILAKVNATDIIAYSGGFTAVAISGICKSNIERLKFS